MEKSHMANPDRPRIILARVAGQWVNIQEPEQVQPQVVQPSTLPDFFAAGSRTITIPENHLLEDANTEHLLFRTETVDSNDKKYFIICDWQGGEVRRKEIAHDISVLRFAPNGDIMGYGIPPQIGSGLERIYRYTTTGVVYDQMRSSTPHFGRFLQVISDDTVALLTYDGIYELITDGQIVRSIPTHADSSIVPVRSNRAHVLHNHHIGVFQRFTLLERRPSSMSEGVGESSLSERRPSSMSEGVGESSLSESSRTNYLEGVTIYPHLPDGAYVGIDTKRNVIVYQLSDHDKPHLTMVDLDGKVKVLANKLDKIRNAFIDSSDQVLVQNDNTIHIFKPSE